jgi:hypothetical protein
MTIRRDQFLYVLDMGLDPVELAAGIAGIVGDPKRLFLERLDNFYRSLRRLKPAGWGSGRQGCLSADRTAPDPEFEERIARANSVPVEHIMAKCGWKLRCIGREMKGACPVASMGVTERPSDYRATCDTSRWRRHAFNSS